MSTKVFQLTRVTLWLEDSIIIGTYDKNLVIDIDLARQIVLDKLEAFQGKSYPVLMDVRNIRSVSKEAFDHFASDDGVQGLRALAILVSSPLTEMIANLFMVFSKPQIPTRVFRTKELAVKWLNKYVAKEYNVFR